MGETRAEIWPQIMALYAERVTQAHLGCDFDFLDQKMDMPEPEIH